MTDSIVDRLTLDRDLRSIRTARAWLSARLEQLDLPQLQREDAALLLSELVANTLAHTESPPDVTITANRTGVRVGVADDGTGIPLLQRPDPSALGGRGLWLVQALSTAWGTHHSPRGNRVWFEIGEPSLELN